MNNFSISSFPSSLGDCQGATERVLRTSSNYHKPEVRLSDEISSSASSFGEHFQKLSVLLESCRALKVTLSNRIYTKLHFILFNVSVNK